MVLMRIALASLILNSLSGCYSDPPRAVWSESFRPFLLDFTNPAADTSGLGKLSEEGIPCGEREIRIWFGFGVVLPDEMVRLRAHPDGKVDGEVLVYYPTSLHTEGSKESRAFEDVVSRSCKNQKIGEGVKTCTGVFKKQPDWKALYTKLVKIGVVTLPDESSLPKLSMHVSDGTSIVVELRDGNNYRSYEYSNPVFRDEKEARSAERIMEEIGRLLRKLDFSF